jgi:hypothetical protein
MDTQERRAMLELQLELRSQVDGVRPVISTDELVELRGLLAQHEGDFKSLFELAA